MKLKNKHVPGFHTVRTSLRFLWKLQTKKYMPL